MGRACAYMENRQPVSEAGAVVDPGQPAHGAPQIRSQGGIFLDTGSALAAGAASGSVTMLRPSGAAADPGHRQQLPSEAGAGADPGTGARCAADPEPGRQTSPPSPAAFAFSFPVPRG